MSALVVSLDFEMFWGVTDSRTIENYGANIEGVWQSVPSMLKLFKQYDINATWATVGMLMCKNYKQWSDLRPSIMPTYARESCSTYSVSALVLDFPKLFFAPALVEQILANEGQELASHTYSHFYCGEDDVTVEQFAADLDCAKTIFGEYGVKSTSLVFPRNQARDEYFKVLLDAGFTVYRGNQNHRLYQERQHSVLNPYGTAGGGRRRLVRLADSYLPLTGNHVSLFPISTSDNQLINIPASRFLRPTSGYSAIDKIQLYRVKKGMLEAARTDGIFHLWWHPHNFGVLLQQNLAILEELLQYFSVLQDKYEMRSLTMADVANTVSVPLSPTNVAW